MRRKSNKKISEKVVEENDEKEENSGISECSYFVKDDFAEDLGIKIPEYFDV